MAENDREKPVSGDYLSFADVEWLTGLKIKSFDQNGRWIICLLENGVRFWIKNWSLSTAKA